MSNKAAKDRDVFKLCMKHLFGLSDHLIQRLKHIISSEGEQHELDQRVKKIKLNDMKKLLVILDHMDNLDSQKKDKKMKNDGVGITFEATEIVDFKSFLAETDAAAMKTARAMAQQSGMGSQAERRVASGMSDREFLTKQAQQTKELEASDDPIDRQILNLQKQLQRLYQQKAVKKQREQQRQQSAGI